MSRWKSIVYTGIKPDWGKAAFDFGVLWYSLPRRHSSSAWISICRAESRLVVLAPHQFKDDPYLLVRPGAEKCDRDLYV